ISWAISWRAKSGRAFVEFVERPFCHRHGVEDRLAEVWTTERVEAGVGGGPNDVADPFDEDVVHGAVVAAEFLEVAALGWNEIGHFLGLVEVADVVAAKAGDEIGIGDEFLARFSRSFQVRWIVRAEASALEAEIAVGGFGRRNGARKLGDGDRMRFVADINDPVGQIDLVAIGVGGFAVGDDEAAIQDAAVDGVERDAHAGILRGGFEAADFFLMLGVGKIEDYETVATESA